MKFANLVLRFLLELCALAALGYQGFHAGKGTLASIGLGLGAPLLAAVLWGMLVAPKAPVSAPELIRLLTEVAVFGLAGASLAAAGHPTLAWALGAVVVANIALMYVWKQR